MLQNQISRHIMGKKDPNCTSIQPLFLQYSPSFYPPSMASSDEEGEIVPECTTDYVLVDSEGYPISFSSLPLLWNDSGLTAPTESALTAPTESAFLMGAVDEGCGRIFKRVIAWKFILSYALPEIYVLRASKYGRWIKLQKPARGYDSIERTALITVHCLHFMKSSKEISEEDLWKHLGTTFSSYEDPPSANDLAEHLQLIKEAALRDNDIAKTKNFHAFLSQIPEKRKALRQDNEKGEKPQFIDHDDEESTAEMKNRIHKLMEDSISSFCKEKFLADQMRKCSNRSSTYFSLDNTIPLEKIEFSTQAVRRALQILQEGGTVEDAMDVCSPATLTQMMKWKRKLSVYLAPFIHGGRYTSFGRHFTNVDKLKQIVNRLRWYVQDGDMIVDFSCGSNDFSCFMKEKLDSMGRRCYFRNYDIIPTRNDFNFEKKDWMTVGAEELCEGSKLIIGLNPPFGVQASLANKFIDKALTFRPKLLILIVPKMAERLDMKRDPYDLIWEDDKILSGKSFYFPGSADEHGQQVEQWNLNTPPLYLWSRQDWTCWHKQIAVDCGDVRDARARRK